MLVLVAYVPLLLSSPGSVPGDTKLYLYVDPWRLISDSVWTWDNRQLGGWVPHQNVGYLWPTGPWFAFWDVLGVADWIAHRLWLGTILVIAGLGTHRLSRQLGLGVGAAFVAALSYQLSPYVLPYISRTSALLLPFALLPWMVSLVVAIALNRRWWQVFAFAGLVVSSGGLNATALLMVAPGPLIWLIHLWRSGAISTRRLLGVGGGIAAISGAVSAWWLAGLWIQGRYGAEVLSYSEALASTAATSSAPEVLRGLGYWLFYDRNDIVSLTSASTPYQGHLLVMAAGSLLALVGLWGIIRQRQWRWPLMTSVLVGTVLAVGAFPFADPSPLWSLIANHPQNTLSLALRSSTRAVPIVVLALAIGLGLTANRVPTTRAQFWIFLLSRRTVAMGAAIILIGVNLPGLFAGRLIDPNMTRPNDLPAAWLDAAAFLDERYEDGHTGSVLLMPGIESAAYRWGYPVDPILPGLTKKPFISRDWLPLGSAPLMDLVFALDDAFQSGTARAESVAPVARLLGADTIMVVNSHQYERFGTIRPERARQILGDDPPGLRRLAQFGPEVVNRAPAVGSDFPNWSEELVAFPYRQFPEIELYEVVDSAPMARTTTTPGLVVADGSGLVDLAAAGLIDGQHILIAEAALDDRTLVEVSRLTPEIFITDSNRRRAHHWRSSQDVWGATEPETGVLIEKDLFDSRLPVFANNGVSSQTIVADASLSARATSYGPELTFHPEHRPAMAIDGDIDTAWRTRTYGDPRGEILEFSSKDTLIRRLRLVQPIDANPLRWITAIHIKTDTEDWFPVEMRDVSRTSTGQIIDLAQPSRTVSVRIDAIDWRAPATADLGPGVGFAEVVDPETTASEVLVLPQRLQSVSKASPASSYLFSRWRSDPLARWREDPEKTIERIFTTSQPMAFAPSVSARLHAHAADSLILQAIGWRVVDGGFASGANGHLRGLPRWWGLSALDGNPSSVWWTASPLDIEVDPTPNISIPIERPVTDLTINQVLGPSSSQVTGLTIEIRSQGVLRKTFELQVPPPDSKGSSHVSIPAVEGDQIVIQLSDIEKTYVRDEQSGLLTVAPVGIIDVTSDGWSALSPPELFDTGCRTDLLTIDGESVALRFQGSVDAALSGDPIEAEICGDRVVELEAGEHRLSTSLSLRSGWDIDTVLLGDSRRNSIENTFAADISFQRGQRLVNGVSCVRSCWLEVADGWNTGWSASTAGRTLAEPLASSGGRNLWFIDSTVSKGPNDLSLTLTWMPQRSLWWGLAVTVMTLFILGGLAIRERLQSKNGRGSTTSLTGVNPAFLEPAATGSVGPLAALIVGSLVIAPFWGLAALAVTIVLRRHRHVLQIVGWILVALGLGFLLAQQMRTGADPGFGWPSVFARAHRPTLVGLVLIWVGIHEPRLRSARDSRR